MVEDMMRTMGLKKSGAHRLPWSVNEMGLMFPGLCLDFFNGESRHYSAASGIKAIVSSSWKWSSASSAGINC